MTAAGVPYANLGAAVRRDRPDDVALIDLHGDGERALTYAELDAAADAAARGLLGQGLRRGDCVAILAANRAEFLTAFLGTMRAGLVSVPINHKLPAATVGYIVQDCGAALVLCDEARRALCPDGARACLFGAAYDALLDPGPFAAVTPAAGEPAMILYTSGSTGQPKGVVLSHQSHLWAVRQRLRPPGAAQRPLVAAPLYHMNALAVSQAAFANGDAVILMPAFTARGYIEAASRHRATALTSVPTMMAMMMAERAALDAADLSAVQAIRMGSAPVSPGLMRAIRAAFPGAEITNGYGTTEAGPICFAPHPAGLPTPDLSVGVPHPAVRMRLVDAAGRETAEEGVLHQQCPALMNGYHNLPEATRRVMTADGFYVTGDVFRRDADGFFYFVGRADDMFVCGGENVYPGEVEAMLGHHPGILQAVVVPVPDDIKGHKPVAFVVRRDPLLSEAAVKDYALAHAAPYLHPRRVWFLPELPLAGTNKIDRRHLMAQALLLANGEETTR